MTHKNLNEELDRAAVYVGDDLPSAEDVAKRYGGIYNLEVFQKSFDEAFDKIPEENESTESSE